MISTLPTLNSRDDSVSNAPSLFVLDVGHGSCAVLRDSGYVVVFDSGPAFPLLRFLQEEGISKIDLVVISHSDEDHIAGLIGVIACDKISISKVRLNSDFVKDSKVWIDLMWELNQKHRAGDIDLGISLTTADSGQFNFGEIEIEFLAPDQFAASTNVASNKHRSRRFKSNSRSVVVRLSRGGQPMVFLAGDIDEIGFNALLNNCPNPHAPILVYPHHGGSSGANDESAFAEQLCNTIKPTTVLFSIGRGKHETPRPEIVETMRKLVPNLRVACTQLSKNCCADHASPLLHLTALFAAGREQKRCCAGTIAITLSSPLTISPEEDLHKEFIHEAAPEGLCIRQIGTEN